MPKKDLTEIICVIDKSGSMTYITNEAITGFNQFLEEQKKVPGECSFTLTLFDTIYKIVHNGVPIQEVMPLNEDTYRPGGMTALLDAVGKTIDEVGTRLHEMPEEDRPEKVLFVILTDGAENASHEYTGQRVPDMIKHQTDQYSWEFMYLGANVDAFAVASRLNILVSNTSNFASTRKGMRAAYECTTDAATRYRTTGSIGKLPDNIDGDDDEA